MAKGPSLNTIGKMGGMVTQRGAYGYFTRQRVKPKNPRSPAQTAVRSSMRTAARAWESLGTDTWSHWANFASDYPQKSRKGETIKLAPAAFYAKINRQASQAGQPVVVEPPVGAVTAPPPFPTGNVTASEGVLELTDTIVSPDTTHALIVRMSGPFPPGRTRPPKGTRQIAVVHTHSATPVDLTTSWEALFGQIQDSTVAVWEIVTVCQGVVQNRQSGRLNLIGSGHTRQA